MSIAVLMESRPIRPPKGDVYDRVLGGWSKRGGGEPGESVFATNAQLLVFAAALGWAEDLRINDAQSGPAIDWSTFLNVQGFLPVFVSVAVAEQASIDAVFSDKLESATQAFECYAAGGLQLIGSELEVSARTRVDALLDFVERRLEEGGSVEPLSGGIDVPLDIIGG